MRMDWNDSFIWPNTRTVNGARGQVRVPRADNCADSAARKRTTNREPRCAEFLVAFPTGLWHAIEPPISSRPALHDGQTQPSRRSRGEKRLEDFIQLIFAVPQPWSSIENSTVSSCVCGRDANPNDASVITRFQRVHHRLETMSPPAPPSTRQEPGALTFTVMRRSASPRDGDHAPYDRPQIGGAVRIAGQSLGGEAQNLRDIPVQPIDLMHQQLAIAPGIFRQRRVLS